MVSVSVIGGAMLYLNRQKASPVPPAEPAVEAAPSRTTEYPQPVKEVVMQPTGKRSITRPPPCPTGHRK